MAWTNRLVRRRTNVLGPRVVLPRTCSGLPSVSLPLLFSLLLLLTFLSGLTIHIPARVVSAPVIPSSHLVPPAAAAPRRSARLQATPLPPVVAPAPEVVPAVVEPSSPVESAVLSGFGEATGPLAAVADTTGTRAPSLSSSSPLPSYPASPTATPPPRFVTPLFTPPPLFLPGLTSPDVPEIVPTALSDGLEGSDPGIETAEGRLRPPQLPAHPSVFRYEEAVRRRQQAEATFQYSRSALAFAIDQEKQVQEAMDAVIDGAADKAARGPRRR